MVTPLLLMRTPSLPQHARRLVLRVFPALPALALGAVAAQLETVVRALVVRLLLRPLLALLVLEVLPGAVPPPSLAVHEGTVGVPVVTPFLAAVVPPLPAVPVAVSV